MVLISTFSLKPFAKSADEFKMGNYVTVLQYKIPLVTDLREAVAKMKVTAKNMIGGPFLVA